MSSTHTESTHAHPPTPPTPRTPPEHCDPVQERLSTMYYNSLFGNGLYLKGLQGADRTTATEVYCPDVRRSSFDNDYPVNHREVVSCWKGLSIKQAQEILTWERIFREALEAQISDDIRELVTTLPATEDGTFKLTHYVDIDLEDLVHTMVALYFTSRPDVERERTWSMSEGDLPSFAYNFVRTRDCFLDASPRPCVQVDLTFLLPSSSIVGEVAWQPPNIDFGDLPSTLDPRATIRPDYRSPDCGNTYGFAAFPDYVDYLVETDSSGLPKKESTLTATTNMYFPEGVRYECTSRYIIKLYDTAPQKLDQDPSPSFPCYEKWKEENIGRVRAMMEDQDKDFARVEDILHTRARPTKRKAEKQVHISTVFGAAPSSKTSWLDWDQLQDGRYLELTTKRQRLYQHETEPCNPKEDDVVAEAWLDKHLDDLGHLSTTCIGEATAVAQKSSCTPSSSKLRVSPKFSKSRAYTSNTGTSRVMPALRKKGSVKRILFKPWARRKDSPMEVCNKKVLEDLEGLWDGLIDPRDDQEVIRCNYDEFVRKAQHSRMCTDEASEAEEYENIFLEGSPGCASLVSEGMSAMSLEVD